MTFPLPGANWTYLHGLTLKATTGPAGFALQNATPTILSWTAPNDGNLHRFIIFAAMYVTTGETGGGVNVNFALPNGNTSPFPLLLAGGQSSGYNGAQNQVSSIVGPGAIVTVQQGSALSGGAATLWAEIWGS